MFAEGRDIFAEGRNIILSYHLGHFLYTILFHFVCVPQSTQRQLVEVVTEWVKIFLLRIFVYLSLIRIFEVLYLNTSY